jgi:glycosyltransferase involved in cell wall biosynthesis
LGFDLSAYGKILPNRRTRSPDSKTYINSEPFRVGMVGRLAAVKNHFLLFKAINFLRAWGKIDRFRFIIVGDGELKSELVAEANKLNLSEAISFYGWRKNMAAVYTQLDAVVLTSKNEGTPVAIIEAMAASRPVVATAVGGVPDLIGSVMDKQRNGFQIGERGLMLPSENAEALAEAILFVMEKQNVLKPTIRRAKAFALANYSQQRLLNDIKTLYESIDRWD